MINNPFRLLNNDSLLRILNIIKEFLPNDFSMFDKLIKKLKKKEAVNRSKLNTLNQNPYKIFPITKRRPSPVLSH